MEKILKFISLKIQEATFLQAGEPQTSVDTPQNRIPRLEPFESLIKKYLFNILYFPNPVL